MILVKINIHLQHLQNAGNPLEPLILNSFRKDRVAKIKLGYSKNSKDWAISSQALTRYNSIDMSAVQRLNVDGGIKSLKI